ncbi:MAG: hypothetical protein ACKVRN_01225 [Pyrinomonadaceae bacterium]
MIDRPWWQERSEFHQGIIQGDFKAPYQYRILSPWLAELPSIVVEKTLGLSPGKQSAMAREFFYLLQRLIATFLLFVFFHLYLQRWFTSEIAFSGTLILAGIQVFTYRSYYYQPDSPLHLLFLTAAAYLMSRGEFKGWLYPLTIVGSLTRETFGLIVPLHLAFFGFKKNTLKHTLGLFGIWLAVQVLLRGVFGIRPPFPSRPMITNLYESMWPLFLFSLMWFIPLIYFRRLPTTFLWMLLLFAPPLIVANIFFGKVEETRLFLDLAIFIIPACLFVLLPESETSQTENSVPVNQTA